MPLCPFSHGLFLAFIPCAFLGLNFVSLLCLGFVFFFILYFFRSRFTAFVIKSLIFVLYPACLLSVLRLGPHYFATLNTESRGGQRGNKFNYDSTDNNSENIEH